MTYAYAGKTLTSPTGIASTTTEFWDLTDVAAETANGGGTTVYLRGAGLIAAKAGSTYTYYDKNAHGDVYRLLNAGGAATTAYVYDAFGVQRSPSLTGSTDTNPFRYCGEYFDAETGSIYLRARYYAPGVGRFTQEDAVRGDPKNPGSLNLYVYCWGNPIRYNDPSGRYTRMAAMADSGSRSLEYHPDEKAYLHSYDADLAKIDKGWSKLDHIPWVGALSSLGHALWYIGVENDRGKAGLSLVNTIFMGLTPGEGGGGKASAGEALGVLAEGVGDPLPAPVAGDNVGLQLKGPGSGNKSVVIGEGMDRVQSAARQLQSEGIDAKWYQAWSKNFPNRQMTADELNSALARNQRWIDTKIGQGYTIYDIGARTGRITSPFYTLEQSRINFFNYPTIKYPWGPS